MIQHFSFQAFVENSTKCSRIINETVPKMTSDHLLGDVFKLNAKGLDDYLKLVKRVSVMLDILLCITHNFCLIYYGLVKFVFSILVKFGLKNTNLFTHTL